MKQQSITFLLTVLMSMVGIKTIAHDIEATNADGVPIYYDYNGISELKVTYYNKDNSYYDDSGNWVEDYEQRPYSGNVAIPSKVTYYGSTYTVTSIGENAFSNCSGLTSVTIPSSVTSIGGYAFYNCSGLTSVIIPSGVTSIGYGAFGYDDFIGEGSSLTSVTVKMETPAEIDSSTFPDRTNETLYVPKGSKAAYETADYWKEFGEIIEISNISFVDANVKAICVSSWDTNGDGELSEYEAAGVWNLSSGKFSNNTSITSFDELQYFTGLRSIGYSAFSGCSKLASVTIPSGVTSIDNSAFEDCSSLKSVTIPSGVTSIGDGAFKNCRGLKDVNYNATNCTKMGSSEYSLVFEGCSSFTTLRIGESVQTIPSYAFYGCSKLTSVTIPDGVTSIGYLAFYNCSSLTSVYIGNSVTSISSAFNNCSGLTSVNISDLAGWCEINFGSASNNPLYYAHHLFLNGEEITDLVIPSNVDCINNYAFYGCTGLTSLSIPSSVTSIGFGYYGYGDNAFSGCSNLATITVDENNSKYDSRDDCNAIIEKESNKLIYGCKNTVIPSSVTSIDKYAFKGCSTLSSIYIPGNLKQSIDLDFGGCSSLTSITVGEGIEEIANSGLNGLKNVTITLPNSLTKIGSQAFNSCSGCTVNIGTGIKDISDAFYNTSDMTIYIHAFERPKTSYHCFYMTKGSYESFVPFGRGDAYSSGSGLEGGSYWCSVSEMPYPALTIGASGYATYCSDKALDFSEIEDVKAYIATDYQASTNTLLLTRVMKIQAGEGVIVVGNPGTYDIPECTTDITYTNLLNGMDYPDYVSPTEGDYANLLFTDDLSFHSIEENAPCFAGTAYLHIPSDYITTDNQTVNVCFTDTDDTDVSQMEDVIYIEPMDGLRGTTIDLNLKMKNTLTPVGCSFMLTLPEGLRLEKDEDGDVVYELGTRAKKMSVTMKDWNNGKYDFALMPTTATATITGNENTFITFHVQLPDDMVVGDYKLKLTKCLIQNKTDGTTKDFALSDVTTTLTVEDYTMGDVNGDGNVTPSDAIMTLYHYFGSEQTGFNAKAADTNGDGTVTPADAIETLYMYFDASIQTGARRQQLLPDPQ